MEGLSAILFDFRYVIVIVIAVLVYALLSWQTFKTKAYALMLQAKSLAKDEVLKSGAEQEDWVVAKIYQFAPKSVTVFINNANMHVIVHWLFMKAKDYLDDGKFNDSVEK